MRLLRLPHLLCLQEIGSVNQRGERDREAQQLPCLKVRGNSAFNGLGTTRREGRQMLQLGHLWAVVSPAIPLLASQLDLQLGSHFLAPGQNGAPAKVWSQEGRSGEAIQVWGSQGFY